VENTGKAAVAEFIGTFALIFFGAGTIIAVQGAALGDGGNLLAIALAHGLTIAIMVSLMGHISGGAFNPAISIALWVTGKVPSSRSAVFIVAQLAGAVVAALGLQWLAPELLYDGVAGGIPAVAPDYAIGKAVVLEAAATFFLVWAVFASAVDDRGAFGKVAGFPIGLTISVAILTIGPLTGAALNPARWFGPALVDGDWTNWWVWIVGPVAGGVIAGVAYWWLYLKGHETATP
jgi:aquaporin Z